MDLQWKISRDDVAKVTALIEQRSQNAIVRARLKKNLAKSKPEVTRDSFWRAMVSMRLTTRQKSGPDSFVERFIQKRPFPLSYKAVHSSKQPEAFIANSLKKSGGIRFADKIASELSRNLADLEDNKWAPTLKQCNRLTKLVSRQTEIEVAEHIRAHFLGFGPKQSRNLLQSLWLTRYEIPIDSRLTDWLNDFGFPVKLTAAALSDENYYRFISDGIHMLCERSGILPCIFDAAVFTLRDSEKWTDENANY